MKLSDIILEANTPPKGTVWSDKNRYSQTGYSSPTLFPEKENYKDGNAFAQDMKKAHAREDSREEWREELRDEAREDQYDEDRDEE